MSFKFRKDEGTKDDPLSFDLFEHIPIGIIIFDKSWKVIFVNSSFYNFDLIKSEFINKLKNIRILDKNLFTNPDITTAINTLNSGNPFEQEINCIRLYDRTEISVIIRGVPLIENNSFNGGILIVEDLTVTAETQKERIFKSELVNSLLTNFCHFYLIINSDGMIKYCRKFLAESKFEFLNNILNKNISDIFSSSTKLSIRNFIQNTFQEGIAKSNSFVYSYLEESINFNVKIYPLKDINNNIVFGLILFNISEENVETETQYFDGIDLLSYYESLLMNFSEAVIILDLKGKIVSISKGISSLCDIEINNLEGKFCSSLFPLLDNNSFNSLRKKVLKNKEWEGKLAFFNRETKEKSVHVKIIPIELTNKKLLAVLCNVKLHDSDADTIGQQVTENFKKILNISKEYIITFRPNGKIIFANPHFVQKFGYNTTEITELNFLDLIDKNSDQINGFSLDKLTQQAVTTFELPCLTKEGNTIFCQVTFNAIKDSKGETKYYNALLKDITNEQLAKTELRQVYTAFDNLNEGVVITEKNKITSINSSFADFLNYESKKELVGLPIENLIAPQDLPDVINIINQLDEKIIHQDKKNIGWLTKDHQQIKLETNFKSLAPSSKIFISAKKIQPYNEINSDSLIQSPVLSDDLYNFIRNIHGVIYTALIKNKKIIPTFISDKSLEMLGYHNEEFLLNPNLFYEIIHPEDLKLFNEKLSQLLSDPQKNSGTIEYQLLTKAGNKLWIKNSIYVKRTDEGIKSIYGFITDITNQKESEHELKYFASELKKLNDTKDRFISIISHDLRTPFSSILGFTDMLLTDDALDNKSKTKYIRYIKDTSLNMLSMLNKLLDWTRLKTGHTNFEPQRISCTDFINEIVRKFSVQANQKEIEIKTNIKPNTFVYADPELLLIVFKNLLSNSIKFTERGGSIIISSEISNDSKFLTIKITDNGIGIKEEYLQKLFKINEKFSTLGTEGERGSGLGLILVQEIIKKHSGNIKINSRLGKGTEVVFSIPLALGNILLVDSSPKDRLLFSRLISNLLPETTIIEAANGKEALEKLNECSPSLIITNHQMPVMDGLELVKKLAVLSLNIKPQIIILSNYLNSDLISEYKKYNVKYIFSKPVEIDKFKEAIFSSIEKPAPNL